MSWQEGVGAKVTNVIAVSADRDHSRRNRLQRTALFELGLFFKPADQYLQWTIRMKQDLAETFNSTIELVIGHGRVIKTQLVGYNKAGLGATRDDKISEVSVVRLLGQNPGWSARFRCQKANVQMAHLDIALAGT